MRLLPARTVRLALLAAGLVACSADRINGPTASGVAPAPTFAIGGPGLPQLVITELMPNPKASNDVGEYVEIFNAGASSVDLSGMQLISVTSGGNPESHTIGRSVVVAVGACVVLANTTTIAGVTVAYNYPASGTGSVAMGNNAVDMMGIRIAGGDTIDLVRYGGLNINSSYDGFSLSLDAPPSTDITTVDNASLAQQPPWRKATAADVAFGAGSLERGTPGVCNYGRHVDAGEVAAVSVAPARIGVTQTVTMNATATDAEGNPASTTFTWSSADESIASIDAASGDVTGIAPGTATITATAANGVPGSATVTVVDANAVERITVSIDNSPPLVIGYTRRAFATALNILGERIFPELTWTTSDGSIATVDARGYVTAAGAPPTGTASVTITASAGDVSGSVVALTESPLFSPDVIFRDHLDYGTPADADPGDDIVITKRQYALSYNRTRGGPNWVSWNLNATQFGSRPRCDCFTADRELLGHGLGEAELIADPDYLFSGYDRGHMVQSNSRTRTDAENAATFLMTNILPQAAENNQGPWEDFESYLNGLAQSQSKEVYVIAGGIYGPAPQTLNGAGRVQVPDWTWKVAVIMPSAGTVTDVDYFDDFEIIAVRMPNDTTPGVPNSAAGIRNRDWRDFITTVDAIERETGYDVLARLPDAIEIPVEAGDRPPVAELSAPSAAVEGSAITLDASGSSDPDGDELTFTWTIGDGTVLTGPTVAHTFVQDGTYPVELTVRDPLGAWATRTATVTVANAAPVASMTPSRGSLISGETLDVAADFTDPGVRDHPWTWSLDWGNGTTSTGSELAVPASLALAQRYLRAGTYSIAFTVTDNAGAPATATSSVTVLRRPVAIRVAPGSVNLNATGNGKLTVFVYGDGDFDAGLVDVATACIETVCVGERGNSGELFASREDADGDGDLDLTLKFERRELIRSGALDDGVTRLILHADLTDGRQVEGIGAVSTHRGPKADEQ